MASLAKGEGELEGLAEMGEELDEEGGLIGERERVVAGCVWMREKRKKMKSKALSYEERALQKILFLINKHQVFIV